MKGKIECFVREVLFIYFLKVLNKYYKVLFVEDGYEEIKELRECV